jgi:putative membrane protein insertion efficiency factor
MKKIAAVLINFYKIFISYPLRILFGGGCRHLPTCSQYTKEAIQRFGIIKGSVLGITRVARCNPFSNKVFDPVPLK